MTEFAAMVVAIVVMVSIFLSVLWIVAMGRLHERRMQQEAERFQREPRIGDKAGYAIQYAAAHSKSFGPGWMVGVIVSEPQEGDDGLYAGLEVKFNTATGLTTRQVLWPVRHLRWFPPDTPLGVNTSIKGGA